MILLEFAPDIVLTLSKVEQAKAFISGYMFSRRFRTFDPLSGDADDYYSRGAMFWSKLLQFCMYWRLDDEKLWPFYYEKGWCDEETRKNRQKARVNVLPLLQFV